MVERTKTGEQFALKRIVCHDRHAEQAGINEAKGKDFSSTETHAYFSTRHSDWPVPHKVHRSLRQENWTIFRSMDRAALLQKRDSMGQISGNFISNFTSNEAVFESYKVSLSL